MIALLALVWFESWDETEDRITNDFDSLKVEGGKLYMENVQCLKLWKNEVTERAPFDTL